MRRYHLLKIPNFEDPAHVSDIMSSSNQTYYYLPELFVFKFKKTIDRVALAVFMLSLNISVEQRLHFKRKLDHHPLNWAASSEFGTYRLCEQRRFRRACASAQSRQNLRCSLIQAVSQEEPSDRKPDPCPL